MSEVRKRFFVNGEPAPMSAFHGEYVIPAMNLLNECIRAGIPQRIQFVRDESPKLIDTQILGFPPTDFDQFTQQVIGATVRVKINEPEIWIDLDVRTSARSVRPSGEEDDEPYFWVGARLSSDFWGAGNGWGYDDTLFQLLVQEPDKEFGVPNQEVGNALHIFRRDSTPHTHVSSYLDDAIYGAGYKANPVVQITDHGLCFTGINHMPIQWMPNPVFYYYGQPQDYWWINDGGDDAAEAGWARNAAFDPRFDGGTARGTDPYGSVVPLWDFCAWLDPSKAVDTPNQHLKNVLQMPEAYRNLGIQPKVLAGQYAVKIALIDGWCLGRDWAAGRNNKIEVEVRVGKGQSQIRKRFIVEPMQWSTYNRVACTYGFERPPNVGSWCNYEYGNNPHWKNWWQGAILVDIKAKTIEARPYYCPTNGSFHPGEIMSNWECDATPQFQITFLGTAMPWSTYYQTEPQFPQVMASMAMEAGGYSGYPWSDPANYPISCPAWCFGGSTLDATMEAHLNAVYSSGLEFGKMYLFTKQIIDGVAQLKFTETSIDVNDYVGEILAGVPGAQTAAMVALADAKFIEFTNSAYNQNAQVRIPGIGTNYIYTDGPAPDDPNECVGDSVHDSFIAPQPAVELEIPDGE